MKLKRRSLSPIQIEKKKLSAENISEEATWRRRKLTTEGTSLTRNCWRIEKKWRRRSRKALRRKLAISASWRNSRKLSGYSPWRRERKRESRKQAKESLLKASKKTKSWTASMKKNTVKLKKQRNISVKKLEESSFRRRLARLSWREEASFSLAWNWLKKEENLLWSGWRSRIESQSMLKGISKISISSCHIGNEILKCILILFSSLSDSIIQSWPLEVEKYRRLQV